MVFFPCVYAYSDGGFRINDRAFEIGLNVGAGFTNDFLSAKDIFQKTFVLDLDDLENGIRMNFDAAASPLYFSYNNKDKWGFGLSVNMESYGILGLSGKMLSFSQVVNEKSDISAAVFAAAGFPGFFNLQRFKIKVKPSVYFPVIYAISDISYTFSSDNSGNLLNIAYDVDVYSAFSLDKYEGLTASPGFDFQLGVEYPLSDALGLNDKLFLLDFDVGLDIINIPLFSSSMRDYMKISGNIGNDEPFVFGSDTGNMGDLFAFDSDTKYGEGSQKVRRPFKTLAWANWRPLGIPLLTLIPEVGFAVNPLYTKQFSMEAGIKARLDISNLFIATLGTGYHDRLWKNSLDLALNLKAFELNIGADLRSQNFIKSWTGGGFGVNAGFKFGF
jgi:hypothetical protein